MHAPQRALQDHFERRALADRVASVTVHDEMQEPEQAFTESRDMFFLSTVDEDGQPTCSYKGGAPGLLKVVDTRTIAFPNYDGNGMFLSMGNIAARAKVGQLFVNCPRYIHRHQRVAASEHVPQAACEQPLAQWKRLDVLNDVISPAERAHVDAEGGPLTYDQDVANAQAGKG